MQQGGDNTGGGGGYNNNNNNNNNNQNNSVSQLQRDAAEKQRAMGRPGASSVPPGAVTDLERQVQDKMRGAGPPPAAAAAAAAAAPVLQSVESLSQLERDVMEKSALRGGGGVPARPGAVSYMEPNDGLTQLERDVRAKEAGGGGGYPGGAGAAAGTSPAAHLSRMEQDIMAKNRAAGGGMAATTPSPNYPYPSSSSSSRPLSVAEQDSLAKQRAAMGRTGTPAAAPTRPGVAMGEDLNDLEQSIRNKAAGGGGMPSSSGSAYPSTYSGSGYPSSGSGGYPNTSSSTIDRDLMAKQMMAGSGGGGGSGRAPDSSADSDRMAKLALQSTSYDSSSNAPYSSQRVNSSTTAAAAAPATTYTTDESNWEAPASSSYVGQQQVSYSEFGTGQPQQVSSSYRGGGGVETVNREDYDTSAVVEPVVTASTRTATVERSDPHPESAIVEPAVYDAYGTADVVDVDAADLVSGGIQAFTAPTIVDVTEVAILPDDDEEGQRLWKQQRRRYIVWGVLLVMLVIIIAVSVVVTSSKKRAESLQIQPTFSPTAMPSMMPSAAPTTEDLTKVLVGMEAISDPTALSNLNSPQYKAAYWISSIDMYVEQKKYEMTDPLFIQRYVLAVLYFAFSGDSWKKCGRITTECKVPNATQWLSDADECTWLNLECDENGFLSDFNFVDSTDYREQGSTMLTGAIPPESIYLSHLETFVAYDMQLSGSLEDKFSNASNLQTLIIVNNNLAGSIPPNIGTENPNLRAVDLTGNKLTGDMPESINLLTRLTSLQMPNNVEIIGEISPDKLTPLTNLQVLNLEYTSFSGQPFRFLPRMLNLQTIKLGGTQISGTLPTTIARLTKLSDLEIGDTGMGGTLPAELFRLPLMTLKLSEGRFNGTLSTDFVLLNETLEILALDDNDFEGPVPVEEFGLLTRLEQLLLYGNRLTGTITNDDALCQDRGKADGQLDIFRVDCNVDCFCCQQCVQVP